jgi:CRISP-associated protein Cas1
MTAMTGVPKLIPARMVNEFVYCPRLFYIEYAEGRFEESDDTALGARVHRVVDTETGAAPLPEEDGDLVAARSLTLSSPSLGVIAKTDLVEGGDGLVVPVDYKKGRPQRDGTPWPSDEVQVVLQALVLADNGYQVDHAEVYYAAERRRVRVELTDERLAWARGVVADARATAGLVDAPLPLVDSPKCVRCSLAGLCLPDETNALPNRTPQPPRRIVPRDPDHRPVYVTEPGAYVGLRGGRLEITRDGAKLGSFRLIDVAQLAVFGRVQVSTSALHAMFDAGTPVLWLSYGGWLKGWAAGPPSKYGELRRRQTAAHAAGGLGIARRMIEGKIRNCRSLLRRNARGDVAGTLDQLSRLAEATRTVTDFGELLGVEGTAARLYFERLPAMLSESARPLGERFALGGRNRRPPRDPVNALLSFCYALLTKDLVAVTLGVGLDPYLGVFHRSRYGRPALALDLAEEFRPLIADSVVLGLLNNGEITESDFITRAGGVALTPEARRSVIAAYERRLATEITHPEFGYKISYRRVLDVQARILAAVLVGELPEYVPMVTR